MAISTDSSGSVSSNLGTAPIVCVTCVWEGREGREQEKLDAQQRSGAFVLNAALFRVFFHFPIA